MNWNRALSGLVAVSYLVLAAIHGGPGMALKVAMFLILPLGCIWFSDEMGRYTGFGSMLWSSYPITEQSPGVLVCIMGWVVLFLPVIAGVIIHFSA